MKSKFPESIYYYFFLVTTYVTLCLFHLKYIFIERLWPDEAKYAWFAKRIFEDPLFIFSKDLVHPPLVPALLSLGNYLFAPEGSYRLITIIINLIGVLAVYLLGKRISGKFLGVTAAIILGFNHLYFFNGTLILLDASLTVGHIILAILLFDISCSSKKVNHIVVGLCAAAIILTKYPGILVLPWVIFYYYFALNDVPFKRRIRCVLLPVFFMCSAFLYLVLKHYFFTGRMFLPSLPALKGAFYIEPFWFYFVGFNDFIPMPLIPFLCVGLFVIFGKQKNKCLLLPWLLIEIVFFSVIGEKTPRYLLPIVPCLAIIIGLGAEKLIKLMAAFKFLSNWRSLLTFLMLSGVMFIMINDFDTEKIYSMDVKASTYVGFKEAAQVIKNTKYRPVIVLATSDLAVRYYADISKWQDGSKIVKLPTTREKFEAIISEIKLPIILEIDIWEAASYPWLIPLTYDRVKYLEGKGFFIYRTIIVPAGLGEGRRLSRVAILFVRK